MGSAVYLIINKINGKCYIGESKDYIKRWSDHKAASVKYPIHYAFDKYGIDNFSFEIIEECSENELKEAEVWWIAYFKSLGVELYNITNGGDGITGYQHTDKTKEKLSIQKKQLYESGWTQPPHNQEFIDKQSDRMQGHTINIGRKHLPDCEHCKILRERNANDNPTKNGINEEARNRMSIKKTGSQNSQAKMTEEKVKKLLDLSTQGFSTKELSKIFGIAETTVRDIKNKRIWKHIY